MMKKSQIEECCTTNKFQVSEDGQYVIGRTKKGEAFLFDTADFDLIKKYIWYISKRGYATANIKRAARPMHKVLLGTTKGFDVDHISRDKLDNRRNNLRICTHQENCFNQKKRNTNTSGYIGVSFFKQVEKYEAYVHFNGKKHYMGLHETAHEAAVARDKGAIKLFGKFANLNLSLQVSLR